jgi:hypothetical protein
MTVRSSVTEDTPADQADGKKGARKEEESRRPEQPNEM